MVAGEASGDLLASLMLKGLKSVLPDLHAYGIGGRQMVNAGFEARWPSEKLAVRGYAEVLSHFPEIYMIRRALAKSLLDTPPDAFVGIDAPDFNLDLECRLKRAGIPVLHFIGPSIWAWRRERIDKIRRAVDHMLVLFPFEAAIYHKAGIAATYVGHPLADVIPMVPDQGAARAALGVGPGPVIALMPGSRLAEIHYNGPVFIAAAELVAKEVPDARFLVPMASEATHLRFQALLDREPHRKGLISVTSGASHQVLAACDAALVASGTATLEAALYKRPMVIAYRMAALSAALMRNKGYQPWVGLPNILAGEFLVPEFLQERATPKALATALLFQLRDDANRTRLVGRFGDIHEVLRCDTASRSAAVIAEFLKARKHP
jgi:lipid-A-disaccharide synthase